MKTGSRWRWSREVDRRDEEEDRRRRCWFGVSRSPGPVGDLPEQSPVSSVSQWKRKKKDRRRSKKKIEEEDDGLLVTLLVRINDRWVWYWLEFEFLSFWEGMWIPSNEGKFKREGFQFHLLLLNQTWESSWIGFQFLDIPKEPIQPNSPQVSKLEESLLRGMQYDGV